MTMISDNRAMMILTREGGFTEAQANAVLAHSRKEAGPLYPSEYIYKRARENRRRKG